MEGASRAPVVDRRNAQTNLVNKASGISVPLFKLSKERGATEFQVLQKAQLPGVTGETLVQLAAQGTTRANPDQMDGTKIEV